MSERYVIILYGGGEASVYSDWDEAFDIHADDDGQINQDITGAVEIDGDDMVCRYNVADVEHEARLWAREREADSTHMAGLGWPGQAGRA